jgi:spore coat polysaccharide biosynthesis protein SpsF
MLEVLLYRVNRAEKVDKVVVATTTNHKDDVLVQWLQRQGIAHYRGSEEDVLDRFWQCARHYEADVIVRVTADDPLKDPEIIDQVVSLLEESEGLDYVSNTIKPTYPEGLDIEAFRFRALTLAYEEAKLMSEREHVTPYIWKNPDKFACRSLEMEPNLSKWRWTVDKPEDLEFVRTVLAHFGNDFGVGYRAIIELILQHPELSEINAGTIRNEGYLKTIAMEGSNE